ncbi:hypothetical protein HUJ05_001427 [Dendroctonus ponderosae]|nr:hypothetical protein HUJ05_001427 [Dendroctonus ponderosae]
MRMDMSRPKEPSKHMSNKVSLANWVYDFLNMVSASWFRPFLSWVVVLGENGGSGTTRLHLENCLLFSASLVFFPCLTGGVRLREFLFFLTFKFTSQMAQETFYLKTIISGIHIFKKPRNFQVQLFVPQVNAVIKFEL